jgi:hypothetical protein
MLFECLRNQKKCRLYQKRAHSKEMLLLAVQQQQLALLETQRKRKEAAKERVMHAHKEKRD